MKIIELSELYKYTSYVKNIEINKIAPNRVVKDHLYKDTPVSHFTYGYNGKACYFDENTNLEITPGTLCYIPKGATIHFKEDEEYEYYKIYFELYEAESNDDIIFSDKPIIYFNKTPKEISTLISEFSMLYSVNDFSANLKFQSFFYSFLYTLDNTLKSRTNTSIASMLSTAVLFMQNNYAHKFSTKDLADMCNLSEPYFRSLFKKYMNMTPTEYKNYLRIRRGCEILINSGCSIINTSEMLGYENVQYFCSIFKRIVGCTPTQYRKGNKHLKKDHQNISVHLSNLGIETPIDKKHFTL